MQSRAIDSEEMAIKDYDKRQTELFGFSVSWTMRRVQRRKCPMVACTRKTNVLQCDIAVESAFGVANRARTFRPISRRDKWLTNVGQCIHRRRLSRVYHGDKKQFKHKLYLSWHIIASRTNTGIAHTFATVVAFWHFLGASRFTTLGPLVTPVNPRGVNGNVKIHIMQHSNSRKYFQAEFMFHRWAVAACAPSSNEIIILSKRYIFFCFP